MFFIETNPTPKPQTLAVCGLDRRRHNITYIEQSSKTRIVLQVWAFRPFVSVSVCVCVCLCVSLLVDYLRKFLTDFDEWQDDV